VLLPLILMIMVKAIVDWDWLLSIGLMFFLLSGCIALMAAAILFSAGMPGGGIRPREIDIRATHFHLSIRLRRIRWETKEVPLDTLLAVIKSDDTADNVALLIIREGEPVVARIGWARANWIHILLECFWARIQPGDLPRLDDDPRPKLVLVKGQKGQEEKKP
jgi:hypothetical protein